MFVIDEELVSGDRQAQERRVCVIGHEFLVDHEHGRGSVDVLEDALAHAQRCRDVVVHLRDNKQIYGTSMRLTRISRGMLQQ